jgi:branched-chain amino acid transport system ATP-binding protein
MPFLSTQGATKHFGAFTAVDSVDFGVEEREAVAIIGPNGAGKTTFLNLLTGRYTPDAGSVHFRGQEITKWRIYRRVANGIVRTFQLVNVFDNLTVYENVALAAYRKSEETPFPLTMYLTDLFGHRDIGDAVISTLETFGLTKVAGEPVASLSLGNKKRLEIAMAWVTDPVVLLLDEPFAGIGDQEIDELLEVLSTVRHQKTVVIVEHKISKLETFVDKLAVMHEGKLIAFGSFEETINHPEVRKSYWKIEDSVEEAPQ